MNSADKIAGVHGSSRTIVDRYDMNWLQSEAHSSQAIPLDDKLGAGHLNTRRALEQYSPGEYEPGIVPLIGWDFNSIGGIGDQKEYIFDSEIGGGYLAATLAWDRVNEHSGGDTYQEGDQFFNRTLEQSLSNLDLFLMPAASNNLLEAIRASTSTVFSVEHIFFNIPSSGQYKLVVNQSSGGLDESLFYSLAWWYADASPPGDHNGDGSVNAADYVVWRANDGTQAGYDEWRANFANPPGSGSVVRGAVPEPQSFYLALTVLVLTAAAIRRPSRND